MRLALDLSLSTAGLNGGGGLPPLSGAYVVDFTQMADGAPGTASTGQATFRDQAFTDPTQVASYIGTSAFGYGKALLAPLSGDASGRSAAYTGVALPYDVKWVYADCAWGKTGDGLGLILTMAPRLTSILASSCHIVFNRSAAALQYFTNSGAIQTVVSVPFSAIPLGQKVRVGYAIVGTELWLRLWTGEIVKIASGMAPVIAAKNHSLVFEHIHPSEAPALEIYAVYADTYANQIEAGYTNIFTAPSDFVDAAWTKSAVTISAGLAPIAGSPSQRVLETATTAIHSIQQTLTKAASAKRYSVSYRVRGVNRDNVFIGLGAGFAGLAQYYGLSSGTIPASSGTFADKAAMVYPLGNGEYQVQEDFKTGAETSVAVLLAIATAPASGDVNYLGSVSNGIEISDVLLYERAL